MEQSDTTHPQQNGQSMRAELACRVAALADLTVAVDAPLVRYHLERALSVLGLGRDRDALDDLDGGLDR
jgi:hypothetical protein